MFGLGLGRLGSVGQRTLAQQVAALFPDVWYDPSDLTTLYQDAAGTTPVTAVEQPVGLMLDKSRGLVLGSELVSAPFTDSITWLDVVSNVTNRTATSFTTSGTGGVQLGGSGSIVQSNKRYRVAITWSKSDSTTVFSVRMQTGVDAVSSTAASGAFLLNENVTNGTIYLRLAAAATVTITNISVRELPGYHAYHTPGDTTTRPTYSRRVNLLTKTEDFSDSAWGKYRTTLTGTTTAPDGTNTAAVFTTTTGTSDSFFQDVALPAAQYITTFYVRGVGSTTSVSFGLYLSAFIASSVTLESGPGSVSGTALFSLTGLSTETWTKVKLTTNAATSAGTVRLFVYPGGGNSAGLAVAFWHPFFVPADLASLPYQRVNTATDYDANPALFPAYLRCDGTNDGMQTNAIDFSATDKMFVSAGVRKLSDAALNMIAELSAEMSTNNGTFFVLGGNASTGAAPAYSFASKGTTNRNANSPSTYAAPITNVLSGIGDISGDSSILRVNGAQAASNAGDQGTGNYGNYPLYLFRRGGSSLPFNGWFYGSVIKGATLTAAQIAVVERYLAGKTKTVELA